MIHVSLFPDGLDNSILTAVLIGLYVRFALTEAFGWTFTGLVVPGYLAAVLVLRPLSAAVILVDALVTYVLVRAFSLALSRTQLGTPVFGRDRFIVVVAASIGTRVVIEALIAPRLDALLRGQYGIDITSG